MWFFKSKTLQLVWFWCKNAQRVTFWIKRFTIFFYFILENVQSFWLWKGSFTKILHFIKPFYNVSDLEIKNFKTCQNWNQRLCIVSDMESKNSQPVRFIFKIFTTCRTLYQNIYNASVRQLNIYNVSHFESRFLPHVRFWIKLL